MVYPRVVLLPAKEKALRKGYPWVFANQIDRARSDAAEQGGIVRIAGSDGSELGLGIHHTTSLIAVRFLTRDAQAEVGEDFFRRRLRAAIDLRRAALPDATHARLVFGESDGLPGLVVDRYGPPGYDGGVITWTCLSYGIEARRDMLLDILQEEVQPDAVVERNDAPLRQKDGLSESRGLLRGSLPAELIIEEEGVTFAVDVAGGPKTGFFIDQRQNRLAVRPLATGRRVLDVFAADGGFGLHAAHTGAEHVHLLDASDAALGRARANAERNGLAARVTTETADALDRLGQMAAEESVYDFIILDPPSFAASRRHVEAATKAYQRLNISALQMLPAGGLLATSSCSQAIDEAAFLKILRYSAHRAGARLRLLYRGSQPADHPVLDAMPETHYLKCFLVQKIGDEAPG